MSMIPIPLSIVIRPPWNKNALHDALEDALDALDVNLLSHYELWRGTLEENVTTETAQSRSTWPIFSSVPWSAWKQVSLPVVIWYFLIRKKNFFRSYYNWVIVIFTISGTFPWVYKRSAPQENDTVETSPSLDYRERDTVARGGSNHAVFLSFAILQ